MWIMYNNRAGRLTVVSVFEDSFTGAALFPRSSCRQHSSCWVNSSCNQLLSWAANKAKNCSCFFQIWTLQGIKFWNMNKSFILLIALKAVQVWNALHNWNKDFDTLLSKYVWNYRRKFDILRRVPPTLLSRTPWVFWEIFFKSKSPWKSPTFIWSSALPSNPRWARPKRMKLRALLAGGASSTA